MTGKKARIPVSSLPMVLGVLALAYALMAAFYRFVLHYDDFRVDVLDYWQQSLHPQGAFHPFHVPGYPWLLMALRALVDGSLPPILQMRLVTLSALLAGAWAVYRGVQARGGTRHQAGLAALLFGLWPLTGLVFAVSPWADVPASTAFLLAWTLWLRGRLYIAALAGAYALLTHKALWPFTLLWWLMAVLPDARHPRGRRALATGLLLAPLAILWALGAAHHGRWDWPLMHNLTAELRPRAGFPLFDGLLGPLLRGDWADHLKGLVLLALFALVLEVGRRAWTARKRDALAVTLAYLALFAVVNAYENMVLLRFGRLLAPFVVLAFPVLGNLQRRRIPPVLALLLGLSFASNLVFVWYAVRFHFALGG